jgi:RNase P/RNase MRP subunit p29
MTARPTNILPKDIRGMSLEVGDEVERCADGARGLVIDVPSATMVRVELDDERRGYPELVGPSKLWRRLRGLRSVAS